MTPGERFWRKVDRSGGPGACWPWTAYLDGGGYGRTSWLGKGRPAHVVAFILENGDFEKGLKICHSCDNRPCCNPAHLWKGTTADNVADMVAKRRQMRGESSPHAKLKTPDVLAIRDSYVKGETPGDLALFYGITEQQTREIIKGRSWREAGGAISDIGHASGARHPLSKLAGKADEIRKLYADGMSQMEIAQRFQVNQTTVSALIRGVSWKRAAE